MTDLSARPSVPFDLYASKLKNLTATVANKLDRTQSTHLPDDATQSILRGFVLVAENAYHAVVALGTESPKECAVKLELALSMTPLLRSMLDVLGNVVFLLDQPPLRIGEYLKAGWVEIRDHGQHYEHKYGTDPDWAPFLAAHRADTARAAEGALLTKEEVDGTVPITAKWPKTYGEMYGTKSTLSGDRKDFLRYMSDWFYREFSQDAHVSYAGLRRRASMLVKRMTEEQRQGLMLIRSTSVMTAMTFLVAVLSEIEATAQFEQSVDTRLREFWVLLASFFPDAKLIYEMRYTTLLAAL